MSELTQERKAELRALAEKATPGPWSYSKSIGDVAGDDGDLVCELFVNGNEDIDGGFIAAANPETILALLAENERLEAQLSASREVVTQYHKAIFSAAEKFLQEASDETI